MGDVSLFPERRGRQGEMHLADVALVYRRIVVAVANGRRREGRNLECHQLVIGLWKGVIDDLKVIAFHDFAAQLRHPVTYRLQLQAIE